MKNFYCSIVHFTANAPDGAYSELIFSLFLRKKSDQSRWKVHHDIFIRSWSIEKNLKIGSWKLNHVNSAKKNHCTVETDSIKITLTTHWAFFHFLSRLKSVFVPNPTLRKASICFLKKMDVSAIDYLDLNICRILWENSYFSIRYRKLYFSVRDCNRIQNRYLSISLEFCQSSVRRTIFEFNRISRIFLKILWIWLRT